MSEPLISVIIPARNAAKTIDLAITSLLKQTYPNLEVIIVDDNSTDDTGKVVLSVARGRSNIAYYRLPYDDPKRFDRHGININAGWIARNYGFERTNGDWVTFQDADDASLSNRIEVQYNLAATYNSNHVCVDWQQFREEFIGKKLDIEKIIAEKGGEVIVPTDCILKLVKETKGPLMSALDGVHQVIPFRLKRVRILEKLFFGSWIPYPGTGGSPLIKREVMAGIKFRPLQRRVWPSRRGKGADRDFNFAVAEELKNSLSAKLPLYLWRVKKQNPEYLSYRWDEYIQK